ncbi:hypothetical protein ACWC24_18740 [Streptomyces sp. NPDC001443]
MALDCRIGFMAACLAMAEDPAFAERIAESADTTPDRLIAGDFRAIELDAEDAARSASSGPGPSVASTTPVTPLV